MKRLLCILLIGTTIVLASERPSYRPKDGYVSNNITAVRIAEAVLGPIYGEDKIRSERPFVASLSNEVWIVTGTLPQGFNKGGVAIAEISKMDGTILRVVHEK